MTGSWMGTSRAGTGPCAPREDAARSGISHLMASSLPRHAGPDDAERVGRQDEGKLPGRRRQHPVLGGHLVGSPEGVLVVQVAGGENGPRRARHGAAEN